jgi:quercetin 2,3-dioxygenase
MKNESFRLVKPVETVDGAGVRLRRVIAHPGLPYSDPFVLLDEIRSDNPDDFIAGFPTHPHRGIETVTYMIEGSFRHRDSRGNGGLLNPGDVQWMTAGRGILHSEMPESASGGIWGYQLWLSLPRADKYTEPRYQSLDGSRIPAAERDGIRVKVITGAWGETRGPAGTFFPVHYFDVRLDRDASFTLPVPKGMMAHAYVHTGSLVSGRDRGNESVPERHLAVFRDPGLLELRGGSEKNGFLFFCAAPLNEPIVRGGPFVMNTREELDRAFRDWEDGTIDRGPAG